MKVTQEKLPASQIGLEIEISEEKTKNTYEKVVKNLARSVNIPGFRKGKVPRHVLLQRLGIQSVKAAALQELIEETLQQAIEQESLDVIGNYQLRSNFEELVAQYEPGKSISFSAAVDVPPTVTLGDYQNLSVKAEETVFEAKEVEDFLAKRRESQSTLVPVENRSAQMGDVAVIDYQGRGENGEELPGTSGADFLVELSEGKFITGFVEGILGMNPEETKEIPVTFPEDYPMKELAGKPAVFTITLKELKSKELPELDDDFAQEVSEFETIAQLRENLEGQFREKAQNETENSIHAAIVEELIQQSVVDLPETMVQEEVQTLLTQTAMQMQNYGVDIKQIFNAETMPQMRERTRPEAIKNLQTIVILREIAKKESLEPELEAVEKKIKEVTRELGDRNIDHQRLRKMVQDDLLTEKTLDWLQSQAKVELLPKGSLPEKKSEEETEEKGE
jgi:trigger factor